jgi:hypothetical protein
LTPILGNGLLYVWFLGMGALLMLFGVAWLSVAESDQPQIIGAVSAAAGIGAWLTMAAVWHVRGTRKIKLLRHGKLMPGRVTHYRANAVYHPYAKIMANWQRQAERIRRTYGVDVPRSPNFAEARKRRGVAQVPCKVQVIDEQGRGHELKLRLNLQRLWVADPAGPQVNVFCAPEKVNDGILAGEFYPELVITADGQWALRRSARWLAVMAAFARCAAPVVATYTLAALGLTVFDPEIPQPRLHASEWQRAAIVLVVTATHAVIPVYFFHAVLDMLSRFTAGLRFGGAHRQALRAFEVFTGGFVWLLIGVWFGLPIVGLAYFSGWLTIAWAAVHVVFANRRSRSWVFIEYGSTSLALLLLAFFFSEGRLLSTGWAVVLLQSLFLSVLDWTARSRWISPQAEQ